MSKLFQSPSPEPPSDEKAMSLAERRDDVANAETGLLLTPQQESSSLTVVAVWMTVNTLATVGIVFTNKAIFLDASWRLSQLTFASFHFFVTWITLFALSRPKLAYFTPRRASLHSLLPLAMAMCLNVVLPNLSLAFSSVTFYQVARILLTPTVALINYVLYKATLPPLAIATLVPACLGVGMVSYYDSLPAADATIKATAPLGVVLALFGIFASSLYTVWIASYQRTLQMSSMQLLYNQAPIASFMLLYIIPFLDAFPDWTQVSASRWLMIALVRTPSLSSSPGPDKSESGLFASLINISQFFIVAQTGPVSSTVVGHVKTCTIVCIGWIVSGRATGDRALIGVFLAIAAIIAYSIVMLQHNARKPG